MFRPDPPTSSSDLARFEALFASCQRLVLAYAMRRSPNAADAEDVVAETFIVAWRKIDSVPAEPVPWLYAVARRVLANRICAESSRDARRPTDVDHMKAAVRERYGSPDVVELRDIDRPAPTGDQLLVRVRAASVNRADLDLIYPKPGFLRLFMGLRAPRAHRLGCDVAGIVEAVGPGVTRFKPGDEVFGDMYGFGLGSFAEYLCAPERAFLPVPTGMPLEDAATLPHAAILAIQGLRLRDGRTIGPGDRLLVVGASGNVGPFAVQIAKDKGAEVTGTCRTEKMDFVRSLGADHVVDYTTTDPVATDASYDWILDVDGNIPIVRARRALRPNGVYVALGGTSWRIIQQMILGPVLSRTSGGKRLGLMLWWKPFAADDIATLAGLMAAGIVVPAVDRRFSLADVVEALRHVDEGRARGKVLVIP